MKPTKTGWLLIKTDGGARGNPGPAAAGVYIIDLQTGQKIAAFGKYLGETTNNVAEYQAVVLALQWVKENVHVLINKYTYVQFVSDSSLLVNQLAGLFKIKNTRLKELVFKVKTLEAAIPLPIGYKHINRENNIEPDRLVNNVLIKNNTG